MICIYHSRDLDGWMSAAIVKLKYPDVKLYAWDYGDEYFNLPAEEPVIMVDVSYPMDVMLTVAKISKWQLTWIDHHASAIKAFNDFTQGGESFMSTKLDTKFAACELTWGYLFPNEQMPELVRLLGRYDCFGHKGTDEERKVLEFQYGARELIYNVETALINLKVAAQGRKEDEYVCNPLLKSGQAIYSYLRTEAKQTYKMAFPVEFDGYKFLCVNQVRFNPINFGIDYHKDGYDGFACFHFQNEQFVYSLYNDNGMVDCSEICKKRGGGGHKGAAGFRSAIIIRNCENTRQNDMSCDTAR